MSAGARNGLLPARVGHGAQLRRILILEAYNAFRDDPCKRTAWLLKLRLRLEAQ